MKETYLQLKERQSKELKDFPMAFAFSEAQFQSGMEKLGAKAKDEVCSVPGCGFILKYDAQKLADLLLCQDMELTKAMQDIEFALLAFSYELSNHEYCVTYDVTDTLNSLGLDLAEVEANPVLKAALIQAKKQQPRG